MQKFDYPIYVLGRYPKIWTTDEGQVLGRTGKGVYGLIDDKSKPAKSLGVRRIQCLDTMEYPLAPLGNPVHDYREFVVRVRANTHIIDNSGNMFFFKRKHSYWVLTFRLAGVHIEDTSYVCTFNNTTTRVLLDHLPNHEDVFGLFLQHEEKGEIFLGFSPIKIQEKLRV